MMSLRRFIFHPRVVVPLIITIALLTYYWHQVYLPKQYEDFLESERDIIPLFDALNNDIVQKLPPLPPDSLLQKVQSSGIETLYIHGRYLLMEISSVQNRTAIVQYYDAFLLRHGWSNIYYAPDHATYSLGTSCIDVDASAYLYPNYRILIWHDYKDQSFTPAVPKYISRFEYGKTSFATCP